MFVSHAQKKTHDLMKPVSRAKRVGSAWHRRAVCVDGPRGRSNRRRQESSQCREWEDGWKCLRRDPSDPRLCRTFQNPSGTRYRATDCATYVREVLKYAFTMVGKLSERFLVSEISS